MQERGLEDWLFYEVVSDYFTPSIKAEVILDTLLTPYVAGIVKDQCGDDVGEVTFITKEMSVLDSLKPETNPACGNMGTKVDYVLADQNTIYLVELKTTDSSIEPEQAQRYVDNCQGKDFGSVLGVKLLNIVKEAFGKTFKDDFSKKFGDDCRKWDETTLSSAYDRIFSTGYLGAKYSAAPARPYARSAMELIRKAGWAQSDDNRSRKYLYTMGQLLDYLDSGTDRTLWKKPLQLIYLTPTGKTPCPKETRGVSLQAAAEYLKKEKLNEELARLLVKIIETVYEKKEKK